MVEYPKLNPEFKTQWIAALRSGDYKQGRMYLDQIANDDHFFCCLGVACKIKEIPEDIESHQDKQYVAYSFGEISDRCWIPHGYASKQLFDGADEIKVAKVLDILGAMNDVQKNTFDEIADWIETNL